jgi:hypothetical protein
VHVCFSRSVQPCVFRRDKKVIAPCAIFSLLSHSLSSSDVMVPNLSARPAEKSPRRPDCHLRGCSKIPTRGGPESTVVKRGGSSRRPKMPQNQPRHAVSVRHTCRLRILVRQDTRFKVMDCPHSTPAMYDFWTSDPCSVPAVKRYLHR